MFILTYARNDYSILDTIDYSIDVCSEEEIKGYLNMGIPIEGVVLSDGHLRTNIENIIRDCQITGSKDKIFIHSDGLVVLKNSAGKLLKVEMRVTFPNPTNIILCKAFHVKQGVVFSVDYQYRKSQNSYEVGRAVYFISSTKRYVNSLVRYAPKVWYNRNVPELRRVGTELYFGDEHLKGYEAIN